jgi:transcriptional regulator EpsA
MKDDYVGLNRHELEHLLFTIETSLKIHKRFQFFLWAQGALQGFIPHETLLCAHGDIARMRFSYETFSRTMLDEAAERRFGDPVSGLLPRMAEDWLQGRGRPQSYRSNDGKPAEGDQTRQRILADLRCGEYGCALAHGTKEIQGESGSFFVFLRTGQLPAAREAYLIELLTPYLHMALYRMLAGEQSSESAEVSIETLLSRRQIQILQWVKDGKTNHEIGQILDISPLTVKNHVQKILRKLKVSNRAQAVGKGAASRLFQPGETA